jgi:phosphoribosylanthranilate isomerase
VTRVKICGVNTPEAFDAAAEAGADWVGFVFAPFSPRYVTPAEAARLSRRLPGGPTRVGLFVDPSDDDLAAALETVPLRALQIYAPVARINFIRAKFDVPVWRPVGVLSPADLPESPGVASALVIEAQAPIDALNPGGNATPIDWSMLSGWDPGGTWLLAGGLTVENVGRAIAESGATAVDVSSGVERARGVKDPALIARFVAAARAASFSVQAAPLSN